MELETTQIVYTVAFTQSDLHKDVYVDLPKGFKEKYMVFKLNKSLYGLRQNPRNFFGHLSNQLQSVGMNPSDVDPCLFIGDNCIFLPYVDDVRIIFK